MKRCPTCKQALPEPVLDLFAASARHAKGCRCAACQSDVAGVARQAEKQTAHSAPAVRSRAQETEAYLKRIRELSSDEARERFAREWAEDRSNRRTER